MDCIHAYFKDDVPYVLCRCEKEPRTNRLSDITPCMCGHQRFCPNVRACTLLPSWVTCSRLGNAEEDYDVKVIPAVTKKTTKKAKT